jgi:hypothetical protein
MPRANRVTFRLPAAALFVPVLLLFLIIPLANGATWAAVFYAVPLGALAWVLITRTTASAAGVTAHGLLGRRRMAWSEMDGLEFRGSRWAIAVGTGGRRLRLPMVRPRDLPALAAVSGGSLNLEPRQPGAGADGSADEPQDQRSGATAAPPDSPATAADVGS